MNIARMRAAVVFSHATTVTDSAAAARQPHKHKRKVTRKHRENKAALVTNEAEGHVNKTIDISV
jgi:hypothetical protein